MDDRLDPVQIRGGAVAQIPIYLLDLGHQDRSDETEMTGD